MVFIWDYPSSIASISIVRMRLYEKTQCQASFQESKGALGISNGHWHCWVSSATMVWSSRSEWGQWSTHYEASQFVQKAFIYTWAWLWLTVNLEEGDKIFRTCSNSVQRSESSSDLQALLKKAKAKLSAALEPTLARPVVARSPKFKGSFRRLTGVRSALISCPTLPTPSSFPSHLDSLTGTFLLLSDRLRAIRYLKQVKKSVRWCHKVI